MHRRRPLEALPGNPRLLLLLLSLLACEGARADDAGLLRCRAIADAAARLACYDALPAAQGPAQADTRSEGRAAAPAAVAQPAPTPTARFGLEEQAPPRKDMVDQIDSRIEGKFEGWWPLSIFKLANGQVWQTADGSSRFYEIDSPKVTITRGSLGAFYLNLDGDNHTVRVRRLQ
ncbi:MAG TPA: hypothetical protein VMN79_06815 [Casimicrobiaceae bacterium]|nr:hypothetical protein [Casimicrobiaceae bacterium]